MKIPIIVLQHIGYSNSVLLLNGENSILVDTGVKGNLQKFKLLLSHYNLSPDDIKLIILTHAHHDHTGNLNGLVHLTGAKVLVHKNEFENLKNGFIPIPVGLGPYSGLISKTGRILFPKFASPKSFIADFVNLNDFDLSEYGIDAKVISTPGHTSGSQSVVIGKNLISGDTFINMRNGMIFPHFANDPKTLLETWEMLFNFGITEIYPGHGNPFRIENAYADYEKWKIKLKKNLPK